MNQLFPVLADTQEIIGVSVVLVIMLGSALANWIKKQNEQAAANRRNRQAQAGRPGPEPQSGVDQQAAQRRRELQELSRARQQKGPAAAPGQAKNEPANLTMAERIARARAKAQYEQRAQTLGRDEQPPATPPVDTASKPPSPHRHQPLPTERAPAARRPASPQQARPRRHQPAVRPGQRVARARPQGPAAAPPQRPAPEARPKPIMREPAPSLATNIRPAAADVGLVVHSGDRFVLGRLDRQALRRAIILKEILDAPVALRDPVDPAKFG